MKRGKIKRRTRKQRVLNAEGGAQCKECRLRYCKKMAACAYYEFVALADDTVYECPDREEGNRWKLMDVG
jgi:dGTP triphosphohydrolase